MITSQATQSDIAFNIYKVVYERSLANLCSINNWFKILTRNLVENINAYVCRKDIKMFNELKKLITNGNLIIKNKKLIINDVQNRKYNN